MVQICPRTMRECTTASMCSPYGGCSTDADDNRVAILERQIAELRARLTSAYRVKVECNDDANRERHLRLAAEAENARLRALPLKEVGPEVIPAGISGDIFDNDYARDVLHIQPIASLPLKDEMEGVLEPFVRFIEHHDGPRGMKAASATAKADDFVILRLSPGYPPVTLGHLRAARSLLSRIRAGEQGGHWREIETNFQIKGRRRSPAYFPATGEECEVSGPNCDDAAGYTWMTATVLWQDELFVLYGRPGFWPNLHKHEHVLFRPLPASPSDQGGDRG